MSALSLLVRFAESLRCRCKKELELLIDLYTRLCSTSYSRSFCIVSKPRVLSAGLEAGLDSRLQNRAGKKFAQGHKIKATTNAKRISITNPENRTQNLL